MGLSHPCVFSRARLERVLHLLLYHFSTQWGYPENFAKKVTSASLSFSTSSETYHTIKFTIAFVCT